MGPSECQERSIIKQKNLSVRGSRSGLLRFALGSTCPQLTADADTEDKTTEGKVIECSGKTDPGF